MRITNEQVREFLLSGCIYNSLTTEKREHYLELYERATKVTSHLTGLPSGGNADHNAVLANLADASNSTEKWWGILRERRNLIRDFLDDVKLSEFHRDILINRYVYNLGWDPMVFALKRYGKPTRLTLVKEHEIALQACAEWVNLTGKYRKEILDA